MNLFQHIGNWVKGGAKDIVNVEKNTVGVAISVIHRGILVSDDLKVQMPTLAAETATVASDALELKALAAAVALCVAGEGVDLAADAGVLAALVTDGPALIRLFDDTAKLVQTAGADIKTDAAVMNG